MTSLAPGLRSSPETVRGSHFRAVTADRTGPSRVPNNNTLKLQTLEDLAANQPAFLSSFVLGSWTYKHQKGDIDMKEHILSIISDGLDRFHQGRLVVMSSINKVLRYSAGIRVVNDAKKAGFVVDMP